MLTGRDFEFLEQALREALEERGVFGEGEVVAAAEKFYARTPKLGAKVVARAWVDGAFKERLLADGSAAVRELNIEVGTLKLIVVENTPMVHNLIVCTLCSCYPKPLLGYPPDWYKSIAYRSRAVRDPRGVLREFGLDLPDDVTVRVHDSTADMRYLVMPLRPDGTQGLAEEELASLVTRDGMVGTAAI
jgi:nitrile hydratase